MSTKKIRVAAIQPICQPGPVADNLDHLETLISEAASRGAELVLLPERFPETFRFDESAWLAASPANGKVVTWMVEMSQEYGLYLGGSFLEARGDDFFNTFLLSGPKEGVIGRVGKDHPCSLEAYTFKPQPGAQVIDSPLGRIGVAICYDCSLRVVWDRLLPADADRYRPWVVPVPSDFKTFALFEFFGRRRYERNPQRRELARRALQEDAR